MNQVSGWQGMNASVPQLQPGDPTAQILNSNSPAGPYAIQQSPDATVQNDPSQLNKMMQIGQLGALLSMV